MPPDALTADQQRALAKMVAVYPVADELGARFADAGEKLYLVGGTVRDAFLGTPRSDLDFATSARPETTEKILRGWADHIWLTGARFGTVSAKLGDAVLEITTFRADSYTPGSRHPEVVYGDDIAGDLARRDLTVNAMALSLPDHTFVDPFGGLADLRNGVLRTPIDPQTSFGDDPLRMVRLARFAAVLDADVDPAARDAATEMAAALDTVSAERIRDELSKLICAPAFGRGLDLLVETRLAHRFIPEVPRMAECRDDLHRHKDVYTHTLAVVGGCNPDDLVLRLAALLHDIGKPDTRRFEGGGKVTFHHHEVVGARLARKRLTALRYPKDIVEAVAHLVALHLRFHGYADGEWTDAAVRRYVRDAGSDTQLSRLNELTRADVTTRNKNRMRRFHRAMDDLEERIARLRKEEELAALRPDLDGNAIMAHLGIEPGPKVGEAYRMLLEARIERGSLGEDGARKLLDEWAREQGLTGHDADDGA